MSRGRLGALFLGSVLALLVLAAGAGGAEESSGHKGGGGSTNIFEWALDLSVWTIVVFVLLVLILKKWAWQPMLEGLHKREQNIHGALQEAQRAREEAQQMRAQWQGEMARAQEQVRDVLDAARRDAERTTADMVAKARGEIQTERDRLRREIETAKDQALQELWNRSADLATQISAKAIRRHLSPEDHRRLVDEALAELNQAGKDWKQQGAGLRL
jgi:F-type H+-transporting ATPase subunit b